jgi:hypothetical protein
VSTLGCIPDLIVTPVLDIHICTFHGMTISLVIKNPFHQVELIAFLIALCIHVLADNIYSIFITTPTRELSLIGPGIHHEIGVGLPFRSILKFTLAPHNLPAPDLITNWNSHLSAIIWVIGVNVINVIDIRNI